MKSFAALLVSSVIVPACLAIPLAEHDLFPRSSQSVITTCRKPGQFALTFDDGPVSMQLGISLRANLAIRQYAYQSKVSQTLQSFGAKGTFFVNGHNYDCIYDVADQLQATYRAGHVIGCAPHISFPMPMLTLMLGRTLGVSGP